MKMMVYIRWARLMIVQLIQQWFIKNIMMRHTKKVMMK